MSFDRERQKRLLLDVEPETATSDNRDLLFTILEIQHLFPFKNSKLDMLLVGLVRQ